MNKQKSRKRNSKRSNGKNYLANVPKALGEASYKAILRYTASSSGAVSGTDIVINIGA
jgi:hypothetical protein